MLSEETIQKCRAYAHEFAKRLHVCGLMNLQLAVMKTVPQAVLGRGAGTSSPQETIWMIEVNPRASRTIPFVKFSGVDITLTPEMKSTGEVMAIDRDRHIAFFKSQLAAGSKLPSKGSVFLSVTLEGLDDFTRFGELTVSTLQEYHKKLR